MNACLLKRCSWVPDKPGHDDLVITSKLCSRVRDKRLQFLSYVQR